MLTFAEGVCSEKFKLEYSRALATLARSYRALQSQASNSDAKKGFGAPYLIHDNYLALIDIRKILIVATRIKLPDSNEETNSSGVAFHR